MTTVITVLFCCEFVVSSNTEKILREQFAKGIKRGISELKIKDAANSPINGLICKTVAEVIGVSLFRQFLYTVLLSDWFS